MKEARDEAVRLLADAAGLEPAAVAGLLQDAPVERGDYAFPCFTLAKERRAAPPKIAAEIAARVAPGRWILSAVAEGPYVNLRVRRDVLAGATLAAVQASGERWGEGKDEDHGTVVVDFSSPNVAKPLAFHHLRSTMIGNSLCRLYKARGWRVVGINHLGDWGTAFGKLLLGWELHGAELSLATLEPEALNELYVRVSGEIAEEAKSGGHALEDRARAWFARLEAGDSDARRLWSRFRDVSGKDFEAVYRLLGVTFDHTWGESYYEDKMPAVLADLARKKLLTISEGAEIVDLGADMPPCLVRKADGATLYATRDLAAAVYRHDQFRFDRALYVMDRGQNLHVRQFAKVLELAGHAWAKGIVHIAFGVIRMGGKRTATRKGGVVLLVDVLEAAIEKVRALILEKNPDLPDAEHVARAVGVGAVVFNDLKNFRENDIDFDLDAITSFEGKTGPYAMYSHARACSILAKAGEALRRPDGVDVRLLKDETEHALVRLVAAFPERVAEARVKDDPSVVAKHLLDLCEAFHVYHTAGSKDRALRVLTDDAEARAARLVLTDAVRLTMRNGLALLGIGAPAQM